MDPTTRLDPNRTMLTGAPGVVDPLKTQAMGAFDPLKTSAMAPMGGGKGLRTEIIASRAATMANGPAREQFLVEFIAEGAAQPVVGVPGGTSTRTPLNLCLVIDRSGSMEGPPLDYVKQACTYVVDMMGPNDVLSIVTFEETVDVLMPPQRVTNKQLIKDGIQRLMPGNTTNLYDGLLLGAQQVMASPDPGRATRLVVLTDGDPTAGIKDFTALVAHAGEIKERGITSTFLGFGPDYNEELLHAMAKRAGGNYYYIPRPELIPEVFRTELEKLMTIVARNLQLEVKTARWVTMRAPGLGDSASLGLADLERGSSLQQVFDFEFQNHPLGWYRVASGKLTYEDLISGQTESVDLDFVMEFTADAAKYSAPVDPKVSGAAQVALASKAVEKTVMGMKTGVLSPMAAVAELQKTQALLLSEGRSVEAQEVTMALRAIQSGNAGEAEKTLMGTMLHLDQGKKPT
ncbi:MAG TPA: VWA domain-containing protein [Fimbriimonadaceae bacterium]|nr:VWA domain-containing protein [Fimbriimonadaceae bacterium]